MSDSYDTKIDFTGCPWDKLHIYLYTRRACNWSIAGLSRSDWLKAILDSRYEISADIWGDTGGCFETAEIAVRKCGCYNDETRQYNYEHIAAFEVFCHDYALDRKVIYKQYMKSLLRKARVLATLKEASLDSALKRYLSLYRRDKESGNWIDNSRWPDVWEIRERWNDKDTVGPLPFVIESVFNVKLDKIWMLPLTDAYRVNSALGLYSTSGREDDMQLWAAFVPLMFLLYEYSTDMSC